MIRKSPLLIFAVTTWLALAACDSSSRTSHPSSNHQADLPENLPEEITDLLTRADMERKIDIVAELVRYDDDVTWLHVDGYKFSWYRISEPVEYAGKSLTISHAKSPDPDSYWRDAGATFRIRVVEDSLDLVTRGNGQGYLGAKSVEVLEELTTIPPQLTVGGSMDDDTLMGNCWRGLVGKFDDVGFDGLSESERVYFLVRIVDAEVNNGGFHKVWKSPAGQYSSRFAYAFAVIGATGKADLMVELNGILSEMGQPSGILNREAAHSKLRVSDLEMIDALGASYLSDQNRVDQLLQEWVMSKGVCQSIE